MEVGHDAVNVFVLGDIVIEHLIPVNPNRDGLRPPLRQEQVLDGLSTRTMVGGAGTAARLIAALTHGRTCLWGLAGDSRWGTFADLLAISQDVDDADRAIIYRGAHQPTQPMNRITWIRQQNSDDSIALRSRIDRISLAPIRRQEEDDAISALTTEDDVNVVHAVVLLDANMKSLSERLVSQVGAFTQNAKIPLIVDPKYNWELYRSCNVICATLTLAEWCQIVGQPANEETWRNRLSNDRYLQEFAVMSLRFMPRVTYHVVNCDRDGLILIAPDEAKRSVYRLDPIPVLTDATAQMEPGALWAAGLAVEFGRLRAQHDKVPDTPTVLEFLKRTTVLVRRSMRLGWHRIPNRRILDVLPTETTPDIVNTTAVMGGVLLLPDAPTINLASEEYAIYGSALVSRDEAYRETTKDLVEYLKSDANWRNAAIESAILTGNGGLGKSDISTIVIRNLTPLGYDVWLNPPFGSDKCPTLDDAVAAIAERWKTLKQNSSKGLLVVIDEAFSVIPHLAFGEPGKRLFQRANDEGGSPTRFLFIDKNYDDHIAELDATQFRSRCHGNEPFRLPELAKRLRDTPYIFARLCLEELKDENIGLFLGISAQALLCINNWILSVPPAEQSPRNLISHARTATGNLKHERLKMGAKDQWRLEVSHLARNLRNLMGPTGGLEDTYYNFGLIIR